MILKTILPPNQCVSRLVECDRSTFGHTHCVRSLLGATNQSFHGVLQILGPHHFLIRTSRMQCSFVANIRNVSSRETGCQNCKSVLTIR